MNGIVLHPATEKRLFGFTSNPSHALIIAGPEGIGKKSVSTKVAAQLLKLDQAEVLAKYPYITLVEPDGQSVSIDAIRELIRFTKLKIANPNGAIKRLAIINHAELLSIEAQNALLKLLEEAPADTVLILNATSELSLLPTIRSRAQIISVQVPQSGQIVRHFSRLGYQPTAIRQAYLMSGGLPGLMHALLENTVEHPLTQAADAARILLKSDVFTRLTTTDALAKQRQEALRILFMVKQMAHAAISQNSTKGSARSLTKWHKILRAAYSAESALQRNAQPKLALTNFVLQM